MAGPRSPYVLEGFDTSGPERVWKRMTPARGTMPQPGFHFFCWTYGQLYVSLGDDGWAMVGSRRDGRDDPWDMEGQGPGDSIGPQPPSPPVLRMAWLGVFPGDLAEESDFVDLIPGLTVSGVQDWPGPAPGITGYGFSIRETRGDPVVTHRRVGIFLACETLEPLIEAIESDLGGESYNDGTTPYVAADVPEHDSLNYYIATIQAAHVDGDYYGASIGGWQAVA